MNIVLKRIKRDKFKELIDAVILNFESNGTIEIDEEMLDDNSELIMNGKDTFEVEIDIDGYTRLVEKEGYTYNKLADIGMKLHKEMKDVSGKVIPKYCFYEKEMWSYLSLTVFKNVIKRLRLSDDDKITTDKIRQYYFNTGGISRTGLMFIWVMIDRLESEDNPEMSKTAFEFIDPVKAVLERNMSRNPFVLQAFVQGIINNNKDSRFKQEGYRSRIPSNISCFAAVNYLDEYDYDELVKVISEQQHILLNKCK